MSDVRVKTPHTISPEEAKVRVQAFEETIAKYGVKADWRGLYAELKGTGVTGRIEVSAKDVVVQLKLGLLARAAGVDPVRLESSIRRRLEESLA